MKQLLNQILCASALLITPSAYAVEPELPTSEADLVKRMEAAEVKAFEVAQSKRTEATTEGRVAPQIEIPQTTAVSLPTSDPRDDLASLVDEVDKLKSEVVITKRNALATEAPRRQKAIGAKTVFNYQDGKIYEVLAGVDKITDIALQPGENLTSAPVAGDTVRWKVAVLNSGSGGSAQSHVILKPLEDDLETNLIITTDRRVYHLKCLSGGINMPAVSWNYPQEEMEALNAQLASKRQTQPVNVSPKDLRFDYNVDGGDFVWRPIRVFDDGQKTWLQMSKNLQASEAPVLFILDDADEPMLTNYRVEGDYYVIDRLFERAQLRVGAERVVNISSSSRYKPGFWEKVF